MSEHAQSKSTFGIVGVGAAACAACCAGPLLAIIGGITIAGLAGTLFLGAVSLVAVVAAAVGYFAVHRRRQAAVCAIDEIAVPITFMTKRASVDEATAHPATEGVR